MEHGQRRSPVEANGRAEERAIPALVGAAKDHRVLIQHFSMVLAVCQCDSVRGFLAEHVERMVHHADVEPEHGQLRSTKGMRQPDGVREARANVVFWNHDHVPAFRDHVGKEFYRRPKITDTEKKSMLSRWARMIGQEPVGIPCTNEIPAPSAALDVAVERYRPPYLELAAKVSEFEI